MNGQPLTEAEETVARILASGDWDAGVRNCDIGTREDVAQYARDIVAALAPDSAEAERLHTWDGLMSTLDRHWPEDLFPGGYDPSKDDGARIVGLLRWVAKLVGAVESCESRVRSYERINAELRADNDAQGVLGEIASERARQDAKWGEQNHPDGTGRAGYVEKAEVARSSCQMDAVTTEHGPRWSLVLLEEVYEALAESDPDKLRAELVQVAAVAVAWVEAIDRRALGLDQDGSGA